MTAITTMDPIEVAEALGRVGLRQRVGKTLEDLIADYQTIHGLKVDGIAGAVTERHLARPRFCNNPDRVTMQAVAQMCRWDDTTWDGSKFVGPPTTVTRHYFVAQAAPGMTLEETKAECAFAAADHAKHGAIRWVLIDSAVGANLIVKFAPIDGPQGVLAETELPCGPDSPSRVLSFVADIAEVWTLTLPSLGKLLWRSVFGHELGHAEGLEHGPAGCLMAPFYNDSISTFQPWDIQQIQLRYGPAQSVVPPVTPTPPPTPKPSLLQGTATIRLNTGESLFGELVSTKA